MAGTTAGRAGLVEGARNVSSGMRGNASEQCLLKVRAT